jgi:phosphatidylglycerol---prolipoprotein diacylglyceryl transferase
MVGQIRMPNRSAISPSGSEISSNAGWSATILGIGVWLYAPSDPSGLLFFGSAAAYGLGRLALELLRADAASTSLSTRINLAFSAMLAVGSLVALLLKLP